MSVGFDVEKFDRAAFSETHALLKDDIAIAVEEYLEDGAAYISEIKSGFHNKNSLAIDRGSHPLKSNSKSFGLTAVSEISEAINTLCRHEEFGEETLKEIKLLIQELQSAFDYGEKRLQHEIRTFLR